MKLMQSMYNFYPRSVDLPSTQIREADNWSFFSSLFGRNAVESQKKMQPCEASQSLLIHYEPTCLQAKHNPEDEVGGGLNPKEDKVVMEDS